MTPIGRPLQTLRRERLRKGPEPHHWGVKGDAKCCDSLCFSLFTPGGKVVAGT